ncbi:MAG: hypothetical protein LBV04_05750 [Deferribacteraceae bacterium]|jgi:hypothetical protein|nr:hypothetical protein [Deferribacteraceae bacterium]
MMRAVPMELIMLHYLIELNRRYFKAITLMFVIVAVSLLFVTGIVRGQCISKGYELSALADSVEQQRIAMERAESSRSKILSKENLFLLANQKGFVMMSEGRTFNVQ